MTDKIPHNALIVVADGAGARFFRNSGQVFDVKLKADGELGPSDLNNDSPSGKRPRPTEETGKENDEATFAKQLAHDLYRRAHLGEFAALVLIADPQTLGQIRPQLHKEVQSRLVGEHAKTMTKASIADIEKLLS